MPFLRFTTNRTLTLQQDRKLKEAAGKVISLFPGKSESTLMMHIEDNQIMYYQGDEQDAMYVDCKIYRHANKEERQAFTEALMDKVEEITAIPKNNIYLTIQEFDEFGFNGKLNG